MRLIDADALKKEFPKDTDWEYPVNTNSYVCEIIDSQPTIEQERKKGKWHILEGTGLAYCECGHITDRYSIYNFCPVCGAKMERGVKK